MRVASPGHRERLAFLRSAEANELRGAHRAPPGAPPPDPLRIVTRLTQSLPSEYARALADQIVLERRAHAKFDHPEVMLFDRTALEQATSRDIARYHAAQIPRGASVVDLGCGLGADSRAFLEAGHPTLALEPDEWRACLADHNLSVVEGGPATNLVVRGTSSSLAGRGDVLYVDPDRRAHGRRSVRFGDLSPSWEEISLLARRFAQVLVKAPPALPDTDVPRSVSMDFLSESFECKELLLGMGPSEFAPRRRAVLVSTGDVWEVRDGEHPQAAATEVAPGSFLLDPDPALRRAGGVDSFAHREGARRVAPRSSYLVAGVRVDSPWARVYRVEREFPYRQRDLVRLLREAPPSEITVKQRGVGIPEATVRKGLPRDPSGPALTLVLFARGSSRFCVTCRPVESEMQPEASSTRL